MMTFRDYQRPGSLEEAWQLNQKRANHVLGGMGWMKMSTAAIGTAIDLSDLGLNRIEEREDKFVLPAMATLRDMETHPGLDSYFKGAVRESVRHIVGVQFRNCATVGGTAWLRAGFSDPLTLFLALDCTVTLYQGGGHTEEVPLAEFMQRKPDNSILTAVCLKKTGRAVNYQSFRNTETDFPVLTVAVSWKDGVYHAAVGARPGRARLVEAEDLKTLIASAQNDLSYDSNLRGSEAYRKMLAGVLIRRAAAGLERS